MAVVERLILQSGQTDATLAKTATAAGRTSAAMGKLRKAALLAGPALLAAGAAAMRIGQRMADTVNDINDAATRMGVLSETVLGLKLAAEGSGTSLGAMESAVRGLQMRVTQAGQGTKTAVDAFARLGVELTDAGGRARTTDDVLRDVTRGLSGIEDPGERARAALEAFGRAGGAVLQALGTDDLDKYIRRAEMFGPAISDNTEAAGRWQRAMADLNMAVSGLGMELLQRATPRLEAFTLGLLGLAEIGRWANDELRRTWLAEGSTWWLTDRLKDATTGAQFLADGFRAMASAAADAARWMLAIPSVEVSSSDRAMGGVVAMLGVAADKEETAEERLRKRLEELTRVFNERPGAGGAGAGGLPGSTPGADGKAAGNIQRIEDQITETLFANLQVREAMIEEHNRWRIEQAQVRAEAENKASVENHERQKRRHEEKVALQRQYVDVVSGSLGQILAASAQFASKSKAAQQALGVAQVAIATAVAVAKAFQEYGPTPVGFIAAGGMVAMGAGQIAAVLSASPAGASSLSGIGASSPVADAQFTPAGADTGGVSTGGGQTRSVVRIETVGGYARVRDFVDELGRAGVALRLEGV